MAKAEANAKKAASGKAGEPAAKKVAKKVAAKKKAPARAAITEADMAQVYAKAWVDDAFRTLLETDPTAALKQYAAEQGLEWSTLVKVPAPTPTSDADENCIHLVSCC
jgi:hypothetical protein